MKILKYLVYINIGLFLHDMVRLAMNERTVSERILNMTQVKQNDCAVGIVCTVFTPAIIISETIR